MKSDWRGLALIERLVVIAIIAILMAILMPALKRAKEQGCSSYRGTVLVLRASR